MCKKLAHEHMDIQKKMVLNPLDDETMTVMCYMCLLVFCHLRHY